MKQRTDLSQLDELSDKGKEKLIEWWKPNDIDLCDSRESGVRIVCSLDDFNKNDCLPLLSIGQMIEFLDENDNPNLGAIFWNHSDHIEAYDEYDQNDDEAVGVEDLCDSLWEACKEVLEN